MDAKEQTESASVLTPSSKGVPDPPLALPLDPPLALPADAVEARKVAEDMVTFHLQAARAAVTEANCLFHIEAARAAASAEGRETSKITLDMVAFHLESARAAVTEDMVVFHIEAARAAAYAEGREASMTDSEAAARDAAYEEETEESSSSLFGYRHMLLRSASGLHCKEKNQWSVNSEDSQVAKMAERMQRLRAGRVPHNLRQQGLQRCTTEPQLEAKLAEFMEQQLSKERTGVGSALFRERTWASDSSGIGFLDKALERRLEQQRLKAEGRRPVVSGSFC